MSSVTSHSDFSCMDCGVDTLVLGEYYMVWPFKSGDYTTLISLGPGEDPDQQRRAAAGYAYTAVAVEVHWKCATGREP